MRIEVELKWWYLFSHFTSFCLLFKSLRDIIVVMLLFFISTDKILLVFFIFFFVSFSAFIIYSTIPTTKTCTKNNWKLEGVDRLSFHTIIKWQFALVCSFTHSKTEKLLTKKSYNLGKKLKRINCSNWFPISIYFCILWDCGADDDVNNEEEVGARRRIQWNENNKIWEGQKGNWEENFMGYWKEIYV